MKPLLEIDRSPRNDTSPASTSGMKTTTAVIATAEATSSSRRHDDQPRCATRSTSKAAITATTPRAPYGLPQVIPMIPKNAGTTGVSLLSAHLRAAHHKCGTQAKEIMLIAHPEASKYSVKPANGSSTATAADGTRRAPYSRHNK
ncbi:hypothetical protein SAMN05216188_13045 [Lentzea xinjiangensis]|uniref:Uncharacterized protein n=1 Tax=Lentzea xinjiangensis TaxID=402600 RepID=A0A1H9W338_9PSEU|nr:hypothetical protein SAMN05216188_13045 [Lentzea xinjiangensis]